MEIWLAISLTKLVLFLNTGLNPRLMRNVVQIYAGGRALGNPTINEAKRPVGPLVFTPQGIEEG
jgi:hypothetical protein